MPFEPWHLLTITVQPEQRLSDPALRDEANARELGAAGPCFTLLDDAVPLAIAGVANRTPGRGLAWAVFSTRSLAHFCTVHRAVVRFIRLQDYRRLEMLVDPRHAASARWAARLGFEREGLMRSYSPDGNDMELWARVRNG